MVRMRDLRHERRRDRSLAGACSRFRYAETLLGEGKAAVPIAPHCFYQSPGFGWPASRLERASIADAKKRLSFDLAVSGTTKVKPTPP